MYWSLVFIALNGANVDSSLLGQYKSMELCFDAREQAIEVIKRPIVGYQAVCIPQLIKD
jgi:hypothetical protein